MREPEIALVFSPEPWVEELHRYFVDHGGARVRQVLVDPALALEESYDILVVSHRWPALTRGLVADLHDRRRRVLGVFEREEPSGRTMLEALGVDRVIESDASPHEILEALALVGVDDRRDLPVGAPGADRQRAAERRAGRITVVRGPSGAGATEVAVALAAASSRPRCVLLDADEVAPSVAARLGLPIEPNLRSAVDAVEFGLGTLGNALRVVPEGGFAVIAGLPNPSSWAQVRPGEVVRVARELAREHGHVIVDVAAPIEDVGGGSRGRYALARALLAEADALVAVGAASPVGVARLIGWVAEARALAPEAPTHVVVNRAPGDAFRRGEITDEITRTVPPASLTFLPSDRRVEIAAWEGALARRGPFGRAVTTLATRLAGPEAGAATGRSARSRRAGRARRRGELVAAS